MNKMKIAHIATVNSSKEISDLGDIDFCLVPYTIKYPEYLEYFQKGKEKRFMICDDSVAENGGEMKSKDFVVQVLKIRPHEVIIPDVIGDYKKTKIKREEFLDKYYNILKENKIKIMSVIQGIDLDQYRQCLKEVNSDARIDTIGIPFRMHYCDFKGKTKEENHMLNRLFFIHDSLFFKPVHCLGVNLIREIISLKYTEKVRSCDSKLLARTGLNEVPINFIDKEKPKKKLYIDTIMTDKQIDVAVKNITKLKEKLQW